MPVVAIVNQKGSTGKTTLVTNLALQRQLVKTDPDFRTR